MMIMAQGAKHMCFKEQPSWVIMERARCGDDDGDHNHSVSSFSGSEESTSSDSSSSSSLELMEDASSSSATSSSNGPLYELSDLMSHLPIKRGLSNYYQGKSQSFTSLASVKSGEDLVKKENPYKRKSKSYGDINKYSYSPKPTIAKKVSRGRSFLSSSSSSSVFSKKSTGFRPPIHVQKSF